MNFYENPPSPPEPQPQPVFHSPSRPGMRWAPLRRNPWLTAIAIIAAVLVFLGALFVGLGAEEQSSDYYADDAGIGLIVTGLYMLGSGITLFVAWLVAGAICWQMWIRQE